MLLQRLVFIPAGEESLLRDEPLRQRVDQFHAQIETGVAFQQRTDAHARDMQGSSDFLRRNVGVLRGLEAVGRDDAQSAERRQPARDRGGERSAEEDEGVERDASCIDQIDMEITPAG